MKVGNYEKTNDGPLDPEAAGKHIRAVFEEAAFQKQFAFAAIAWAKNSTGDGTQTAITCSRSATNPAEDYGAELAAAAGHLVIAAMRQFPELDIHALVTAWAIMFSGLAPDLLPRLLGVDLPEGGFNA